MIALKNSRYVVKLLILIESCIVAISANNTVYVSTGVHSVQVEQFHRRLDKS